MSCVVVTHDLLFSPNCCVLIFQAIHIILLGVEDNKMELVCFVIIVLFFNPIREQILVVLFHLTRFSSLTHTHARIHGFETTQS